MSPTGIYLFEVNNRNSRTMWEICLNLTININDVVLVSSVLTLNRFHTLFWCFHCWLWISKCQLGQFCSVKALAIYDDCDTSHTTNKNFIIKMNFTWSSGWYLWETSRLLTSTNKEKLEEEKSQNISKFNLNQDWSLSLIKIPSAKWPIKT